MKIKFYGTRGSIPVCGKEYYEFGGDTSCIQFTAADTKRTWIIDAGTGIRRLGKDLLAQGHQQKDIFIGFTHFHWDHIQGLPFFAPAYIPDYELTIIALGKGRNLKSLRDIFSQQMQEEYFPLNLDNIGATFYFEYLEATSTTVRGTKVKAVKHEHPGGAFTYRFVRNGKIVVLCTDIEHGGKINEEIVELSKGADLLIHDGQYTEEELKTRRGWGHSSYEEAMTVAEMAGVKQLIITHHDPNHDDEFLLAREKECQARFPNCLLARDGMEIVL